MKQIENIKNKRILILLVLTIALSFVNFNLLNRNFNSSILDLNPINDIESFDDLKVSDYSSSYSGTGEDMNILLHQAYLNNSFKTYLNASDPTNNTFYIPCPKETTFNSSYTRFDINNIYAPNKTLLIEDTPHDADSNLKDYTYMTSFRVNSSSLLINGSFNLYYNDGGTPTITVYLYNSTWINSRSEPDTDSEKVITTFQPTSIAGGSWYQVDLQDTLLDKNKTENGTWFIALYRTIGAIGDNPA
ncbi:MAG: hypothetical protein ACFFEY_17010 [Candidatus Thorarchaeota archaeon]